jgi:hypothetical protein
MNGNLSDARKGLKKIKELGQLLDLIQYLDEYHNNDAGWKNWIIKNL